MLRHACISATELRMAKRNTACLWRHWRGGVGAAWLTLALAVALCSGENLHGAASILGNAASSNAILASLEYQETSYSIMSRSGSVTPQAAPFKKEPAAAPGKTVRGVLNFLGDSSTAIPFLWQEDAGKLYLDLNRNQDLTDDPSGVFATPAAKPVSFQTSPTSTWVSTPAGKYRVLADITLYDYGSQAIMLPGGALVLAGQGDVARAGLAGGHRSKMS